MLWYENFELSEFLDELLESNNSTLGLITPDKCLFKWIEMLQLNLERPETLLNLQLLLLGEFHIAYQFDMICVLLVPVNVDGVGSRRHTDRVLVSEAVLVLAQKGVVTSLLTQALENVLLLRFYRVGDQDG